MGFYLPPREEKHLVRVALQTHSMMPKDPIITQKTVPGYIQTQRLKKGQSLTKQR